MPDPSLIQRERTLLRDLTALFEHRAKTETELVEQLRSGRGGAEQQFEDALKRIQTASSAELASIQADHDQRLSDRRAEADAELARARKAMDTQLAKFNEKTNRIGSAAKKQLSETLWLLDTVVESGESKIRSEYELAKKLLKSRAGTVSGLESSAATLLLMFRHKPLPQRGMAVEPALPSSLGAPSDETGNVAPGKDAPGDSVAPPVQAPQDAPPGPALPTPSPLTTAELFAAYEESKTASSAAYRALDDRVRPRALQPGPLMLISGGVAAAGAAIAYFLVNQSEVAPLLEVAAASLAGAVVLLLILKFILRRRVSLATERLAGAIASARTLGEQCVARNRADRDSKRRELHARRDHDFKIAKATFEAAKEIVNRRNGDLMPRLRDRHAGRMGRIRQRLADSVAALEAQCRQESEASDRRREHALADATGRRDTRLRQLESDDLAGWDELIRAWRDGLARLHAEREALATLGDTQWPDWHLPFWQSYKPPTEAIPAARFGRLEIELAALPGGLPTDPRLALTSRASSSPPSSSVSSAFSLASPTQFQLPAFLDLMDRGSMLIQAGPDGRDAALALLRDLMLRLLTGLPPAKVRFTIIDPVGLGQSFAGFMHLADFEESLVSDRIWTEPRHIEQKLADLTEHMETVIQKYLRNEYDNIQQYNAAAGEVAEPYRFLVIADFPASITETAAKRLASIIASGPRCGVYTLIASDLKKPPSYIPLAAIERESIVLAWKEGRFVYKDEDFGRWPLESEWPPAEDELTRLLTEFGTQAKDATRVQVPFEMVAPSNGDIWSLDTAHEIRVPLGRAGAKKLQYLSLGQGTTQHALIAGRTGSGKSTLLHVLVTNLALWYSPDEIEFYLVDFKKGVEFKTYATHTLPHARVIAVESEREFGLSVLRKLDAELTKRGELFRQASVQDMAGYRRAVMQQRSDAATQSKSTDGAPSASLRHSVAASLPRILLVVDEFQEFFVEDDKIAQEASLLLDRLVRQGRAFGMHVVLGSQTLGGAYSIARSTIGQMAVRIALQCSEADSYLIMSEDNSAPRLLSRPGEAIYNDASGNIEGNSPFQIVWLPEHVRDASLQKVRDKLDASGHAPPPAPIVFEGNVPADLRKCAPLMALLSRAEVPLLSRAVTPPTLPTAWLGEAISIKDPTHINFPRHSGASTLIVGHQEEPGISTLAAIALGLSASAPTGGASSRAGPFASTSFFLLDGTPADSALVDLLPNLFSRLPFPTRTAGPRLAPALLAEIGAEIEKRTAPDAPDPHHAPPIFLFIAGIQRFRDLRRTDDFSFSEEAKQSPAALFSRILAEGPAVGIHTIVWCDTVTNVDRMLDRAALREFDTRILFQMSQNDSTQLIDTPVAAALGRHRAILSKAEQGILEKFRPYSPPDPQWLSSILARLGPPAAEPARK